MSKFETKPVAAAALKALRPRETHPAGSGDAEAPKSGASRRGQAKSATCFPFTEKNILTLQGPGPRSTLKSIEYSDTVVPGLKVEVGRSGQGKFRYRYTLRGQKRGMPLGTVGAVTLAEVRKSCLDARADIDRGIDPQQGSDRLKAMPTFEEFALGAYLEWSRTAKRSHDDDESRLRLHLVPRWGQRRLCDVTRRDVDMMMGEMAKKRRAGTVNRLLSLASAVFRQAERWGIVAANPCAGVSALPEPVTHENYLTTEELGRYLDALARERNRVAAAALEVLAFTGCRREEILQLEWVNVDLERAMIRLVKTKNGHVRHVPLPKACVERLTAMKAEAQGPYVFPGRDGPHKPINNVLKVMNHAVKAAKIGRHVRIHDLRHSVGANLAQAGASLLSIGHTLGHRSTRVTQRYAHLNDQVARDNLEAMAERLAKARAANQPGEDKREDDDEEDPQAA